jgi:hypothetical protein
MNKLCLLILITIASISCDGRHRAYMKNEAILREANLFESFSEEFKYIPERPTEIVTDTLLSNGFHIKTIYHSLDNSFVSKKVKTKTVRLQTTTTIILKSNFKFIKATYQYGMASLTKRCFMKRTTMRFGKMPLCNMCG